MLEFPICFTDKSHSCISHKHYNLPANKIISLVVHAGMKEGTSETKYASAYFGIFFCNDHYLYVMTSLLGPLSNYSFKVNKAYTILTIKRYVQTS